MSNLSTSSFSLRHNQFYGAEMLALSISLARVQYTVLTNPNKDEMHTSVLPPKSPDRRQLDRNSLNFFTYVKVLDKAFSVTILSIFYLSFLLVSLFTSKKLTLHQKHYDNALLFSYFSDAKHMTIAKIYTAKLIWENYKNMKKSQQPERRKSIFVTPVSPKYSLSLFQTLILGAQKQWNLPQL